MHKHELIGMLASGWDATFALEDGKKYRGTVVGLAREGTQGDSWIVSLDIGETVPIQLYVRTSDSADGPVVRLLSDPHWCQRP